MMITSMLVGVDDSPGARAAIRWADRFARAQEAGGNEIAATAMTAWSRPALDTRAVFDDDIFERAARRTVEQLTAELPDSDRFEQVVRFGYPTFAIINEANAQDVDLIVIGSRGRGAIAQVILGSISRGVAAKAERPVAVVPAAADPTRGPDGGPAAEPSDGGTADDRPTVVGFDGSSGARAALRWTLDNLDGSIVAVSAWTLPSPAVFDPADPEIEHFRSATEEALMTGLKEVCGGTVDGRIKPMVQHEDPRIALLDSRLDPAQIVIGARAERGLKGVLLGSTVNYVASHSTVPVFIIPPVDDAD